MRFGSLTCSQVAASLRCRESKATQAWEPALLKVATLLLDYPAEALEAMAAAMASIRDERDQAEQRRFEAELAERVRRQTGRADVAAGRSCGGSYGITGIQTPR